MCKIPREDRFQRASDVVWREEDVSWSIRRSTKKMKTLCQESRVWKDHCVPLCWVSGHLCFGNDNVAASTTRRVACEIWLLVYPSHLFAKGQFKSSTVTGLTFDYLLDFTCQGSLFARDVCQVRLSGKPDKQEEVQETREQLRSTYLLPKN